MPDLDSLYAHGTPTPRVLEVILESLVHDSMFGGSEHVRVALSDMQGSRPAVLLLPNLPPDGQTTLVNKWQCESARASFDRTDT